MTSQPNTGAYQKMQCTSLCHPRLLPPFSKYLPCHPYTVSTSSLGISQVATRCFPIYMSVNSSQGTCHVISGNPRSFQDPPNLLGHPSCHKTIPVILQVNPAMPSQIYFRGIKMLSRPSQMPPI